MNNRPKGFFPNMKATMETKPKDLYEPPTVLDISPITVNVAAGGPSNEGGEGEGGGYNDDGSEDD